MKVLDGAQWYLKVLMLLVCLGSLCAEEKRIYHPVTIAQLASGKVIHTHVRLTGKVKLVKKEADGDLHIRISDGRVFVVLECVPELPCDAPKVGQMITAQGITRYDSKHKWFEIHPVEQLSISK